MSRRASRSAPTGQRAKTTRCKAPFVSRHGGVTNGEVVATQRNIKIAVEENPTLEPDSGLRAERRAAAGLAARRIRRSPLLPRCAVLLLLVSIWGCRSKDSSLKSGPASQAELPAAASRMVPGPVETEFRNVDFHAGPGAVLHIRRLRGELVPTRPDAPPTFDDRSSFLFKMSSGVVALAPADLAGLMNGYTFAYPAAPVRDIKITITGDRLKQEGTLRKGLGISFQIEGDLSATADGLVRLHSTGIKSAHLPVKGLIDLFGVKLAGLVNLNPSRGVRVEGDDMFLNPSRMLPPPRIEGKVTAAKIENGEVVLVFGADTGGVSGRLEPLSRPDPDARNYMYFRGGTLRFGKLTMVDSDLEIVDMDPSDPLDFDLAEYNRQLVAGYSKSTAANGLIVIMPDLYRLGRANSTSKSPSNGSRESKIGLAGTK